MLHRRILPCLLVGACSLVPARVASQERHVDAEMVAQALLHARTVIPDGRILLSDTSHLPYAVAAEAAERAGYGFGPDTIAVSCIPQRRCYALGPHRGIVFVDSLLQVTETAAIVELRMMRITPEGDPIYEQVDELRLRRSRSGWKIAGVRRLEET